VSTYLAPPLLALVAGIADPGLPIVCSRCEFRLRVRWVTGFERRCEGRFGGIFDAETAVPVRGEGSWGVGLTDLVVGSDDGASKKNELGPLGCVKGF
jgi:hypothetical protein